MNKKILNEINRNRQLMGIVEQTQGKLIKKGKFADVNYEMYEDVTKFHMGPFSIDNKEDIEKVFLERLDEIGIPERECSPIKVEGKTVSCEIITDKVKKLLGLDKSELDEQGFIDAIKKGIDKGKEMTTKSDDTNKPLKVEEYEEGVIIRTFPEYTTIELIKPGSRQSIQRIADDIARTKKLGEYIKRQVFALDNGGEKLIVHYKNN